MSTGEQQNGMQIVIHNHPERRGWIGRWFVRTVLLLSIVFNIVLFASVAGYVSQSQVWEKHRDGDVSAQEKIAFIPVNGLITADAVRAPIKELKRAAEDDSVKAVILEVDTPGGTLSGSDQLYHAVREFKTASGGRKPVVAFMKGSATSGGYYVSVAADKIIAERSCITGSIGVIVSLFHGERLLDKIGVTPEVVKSGSMKDSGSMFRPMTEEERREWQKLVDSMYRQFLDVVLAHRGAAIGGEAALKPIADGRVLVAQEALNKKLIDAIGYEQDAVAEAKKLAGLGDKMRIVEYSRPGFSFSSLFFGSASAPRPLQGVAAALEPQLLLLPASSLASLIENLGGALP